MAALIQGYIKFAFLGGKVFGGFAELFLVFIKLSCSFQSFGSVILIIDFSLRSSCFIKLDINVKG